MILFLAVSIKTVEWYTQNLENHFAGRPLDLANTMHENALRLFSNLGQSKYVSNGGQQINDGP